MKKALGYFLIVVLCFLPAVESHSACITEPAKEPAPAVALTFDDGPHPVWTAVLLDGLKERGVKATFFVLGEKAAQESSLLKRMHREGHLIGNHTYSHCKLDSMSHEDAVAEILDTNRQIAAITGETPELIRPPFGIWNRKLEYEVIMLPVLWTVDTLDWTTKNVPRTVERATKEIQDQDIILFHDCYPSSVEAALRTVDVLQKQGFQFVTVDEMILE